MLTDFKRSHALNTSHLQLTEEPRSAVSAGRVHRHARKSSRVELAPGAVPDETLEIDDRVAVSPAQAIESKLTRLLEEAWVPVSHLQMRAMVKAR
jgi:hypothetical protein